MIVKTVHELKIKEFSCFLDQAEGLLRHLATLDLLS